MRLSFRKKSTEDFKVLFLSLQWSVTASPSVTGWTGLTSIILLSVKQSDNVTSEYVLEDGPGYKDV